MDTATAARFASYRAAKGISQAAAFTALVRCGCCAAGHVYSRKTEVAAIELIDGAYDIIELWRADSPAKEAWRKAWLRKAKTLGANPSW